MGSPVSLNGPSFVYKSCFRACEDERRSHVGSVALQWKSCTPTSELGEVPSSSCATANHNVSHRIEFETTHLAPTLRTVFYYERLACRSEEKGQQPRRRRSLRENRACNRALSFLNHSAHTVPIQCPYSAHTAPIVKTHTAHTLLIRKISRPIPIS